MKHLGDITKISGAEAPVVDCIIGGSPCQDLSIAGRREGLAGKRSGLFMEQIRIVKEMRQHERDIGRTGQHVRPRYMVWENVPGAFSSNKGKDFCAVLEETIRVAEPEAPPVPVPEKGWPTSGCLWDEMGKWSVAWRVLDAQFWGVPQRRRRIALVADFGGLSAGEILFECEGVRGYFETGRTPWQSLASYAKDCTGADDRAGESAGAGGDGRLDAVSGGFCPEQSAKTRGIGWEEELSPTLRAGVVPGVVSAVTLEPGIAAREGGHIYEGVCGTLRAEAGDNRMAVAYTLKIRSGCEGGEKGALIQTDKSATLSTLQDQTLFQPVCAGFKLGNSEKAHSIGYEEEKSPTLNAECGGNKQGGNVMGVCYDVSGTLRAQEHGHQPFILDMSHACDVIRNCGDVVPNPQARMGTGGNQVPLVAYSIGNGQVNQSVTEEVVGTLNTMHDQQAVICPNIAHTLRGVGNDPHREDAASYPIQNMRVRRLTPMECERLQGFPDHWTDIEEWVDSKGKKHKCADAPRYKALGNSIAIPPWKWVLKRLCACYEREATMASLFDGIGGFPYIWEQLNGKGSCLWASEIEEFPIAVTKLRFRNE